jgi:hypothetical protein
MANLDHAELRHAILYKAMDLWAFNDNSRDWNAEIFELYAGFKELAKNQEDQLQADRIEGTKTRLAFEAYAGTYSHPMYGNAIITASEEGLTLNFNNFAAFRLQHWHYDTFRSDTNNRYLTELMVNFNFGPDGAVSELEAMGQSFQKKNE